MEIETKPKYNARLRAEGISNVAHSVAAHMRAKMPYLSIEELLADPAAVRVRLRAARSLSAGTLTRALLQATEKTKNSVTARAGDVFNIAAHRRWVNAPKKSEACVALAHFERDLPIEAMTYSITQETISILQSRVPAPPDTLITLLSAAFNASNASSTFEAVEANENRAIKLPKEINTRSSGIDTNTPHNRTKAWNGDSELKAVSIPIAQHTSKAKDDQGEASMREAAPATATEVQEQHAFSGEDQFGFVSSSIELLSGGRAICGACKKIVKRISLLQHTKHGQGCRGVPLSTEEFTAIKRVTSAARAAYMRKYREPKPNGHFQGATESGTLLPQGGRLAGSSDAAATYLLPAHEGNQAAVKDPIPKGPFQGSRKTLHKDKNIQPSSRVHVQERLKMKGTERTVRKGTPETFQRNEFIAPGRIRETQPEDNLEQSKLEDYSLTGIEPQESNTTQRKRHRLPQAVPHSSVGNSTKSQELSPARQYNVVRVDSSSLPPAKRLTARHIVSPVAASTVTGSREPSTTETAPRDSPRVASQMNELTLNRAHLEVNKSIIEQRPPRKRRTMENMGDTCNSVGEASSGVAIYQHRRPVRRRYGTKATAFSNESLNNVPDANVLCEFEERPLPYPESTEWMNKTVSEVAGAVRTYASRERRRGCPIEISMPPPIDNMYVAWPVLPKTSKQ